MSKRGYISRYMLILKAVRNLRYPGIEDIQKYIDRQLPYLIDRDDTIELGISKRTIQRDLKDINSLFGINIEYNRIRKGYHILSGEGKSINFEWLMQIFDLMTTLHLTDDLHEYILPNPPGDQGLKHLSFLLDNIRNKQTIHFEYTSFQKSGSTKRKVKPYALKEFQRRWYLIAEDKSDKIIKSFALERMLNPGREFEYFVPPDVTYIRELYKNSFGIYSYHNEPPASVVLRFNPDQAGYLKSLPLHHSQIVKKDNSKEFVIEIYVFLSFDLVMKILSYGNKVEVLKPMTFRNYIHSTLKDTIKQYEITQ